MIVGMLVEVGTCGHGQEVMSFCPFSLAGSLIGGRGPWEDADRLGPAL